MKIGFNSLIRAKPYLISFLIGLYILARPQIITAQAPIVSGQADKIYEQHHQAVVIIMTYDQDAKYIGKGSGFIVRSDGAIMTNLHVLNDAVSIKVKIAKDKYLEAEGILYSDAANDLVILKAKGENLPIVKLGDSDKIKLGENVYVVGSPGGLENSIITDGVIIGRQEMGWNQKGIQISTPVSHGSSGSPVFNEAGEVIGVVASISMLTDLQSLNFAVPINIIKNKVSEKKITSMEKFAEDFSTSAYSRNFQGDYLYENGKYKEAIESYQEAIRIKPDYVQAHCNLGDAYKKSGEFPKAIESYKQAIRIKPDYVQAYYNLGNAYYESEDYPKAIESYKQSIRIKPDADAHCNLGNTYYESGDYPKAIESYKQAIRIKPDYVQAYCNLGKAYYESGDYPKAIESFKQAIRLKPDLADAHYGLGVSYLLISNRNSALEEYKIIKELDKELAEDLLAKINGAGK
ncbi:MAG: tetratricopeptide repeat-containing serine protease family protein [Planctomycetota bacterium]